MTTRHVVIRYGAGACRKCTSSAFATSIYFTKSLRRLFALFAVSIALSALVYSLTESRSFLDGIWWAFVTASTVGYGDQYPNTLLGRITAIILISTMLFYILPSIAALMIMQVIEDRNEFTHEEQVEMMHLLTTAITRLNDVHTDVDHIDELNASLQRVEAMLAAQVQQTVSRAIPD